MYISFVHYTLFQSEQQSASKRNKNNIMQVKEIASFIHQKETISHINFIMRYLANQPCLQTTSNIFTTRNFAHLPCLIIWAKKWPVISLSKSAMPLSFLTWFSLTQLWAFKPLPSLCTILYPLSLISQLIPESPLLHDHTIGNLSIRKSCMHF